MASTTAEAIEFTSPIDLDDSTRMERQRAKQVIFDALHGAENNALLFHSSVEGYSLETDGVWINSGSWPALSAEASVSFFHDHKDALRVGADNSAHGVVFANINLFSPHDETVQYQGIVAIKPYFKKREKAESELNAHKRLAELELPTLNPLAIGNFGSVTFMLTEYEHIMTFDNISWHEHTGGSRSDFIEERIRKALGMLAVLHDHGFAHGDYQIKNVAVDQKDEPRFIDLENLTEATASSSARQFEGDLRSLWRSLRLNHLLPDATKRVVHYFLQAVFLDGYLQHRSSSESAEATISEFIDRNADWDPRSSIHYRTIGATAARG